jgi:hypothetical protein
MGIKEKLRNLANNILYMIGDSSVILKEKIETCKRCGEEFNRKREAILILPCIHVIHARCFGDGVCPEEDCEMLIDAVIETVEMEESDEDTIKEEIPISPEFREEQEEIQTPDNYDNDCGSNSENNWNANKRKRENKGIDTKDEQKIRNKKQKRNDERKEKLEQIIEKLLEPIVTEWGEIELKELEEEGTVTELFHEIGRVKEINRETNRMVIKGYYNLGKKIANRIGKNEEGRIRKIHKEIVNEIMKESFWDNLPKKEEGKARRKVRNRKDRALKIYELFKGIGERKIRNVKPNMTNFLLDITWEEIEYIIENIE